MKDAATAEWAPSGAWAKGRALDPKEVLANPTHAGDPEAYMAVERIKRGDGVAQSWTTNVGGRTVELQVVADTRLFVKDAMTELTRTVERLAAANPPASGPIIVQILPMDRDTNGWSRVGSGKLAVASRLLESSPQSIVDRAFGYGGEHSMTMREHAAPGLSDVARITTHEWGHAISPIRDDLPVSYKSAGVVKISKYAKTKDIEMVAEAFVDWTAKGSDAAPVSKTIAAFYGWN